MAFWEEEEFLESGVKNKTEQVHLRFVKKGEREYYDVRSYFESKEDPEKYNHSSKGAVVPRELAVKFALAILEHEKTLVVPEEVPKV